MLQRYADTSLRPGARNVHAHLPLLDAGGLAGEMAQVVELGAANAAAANHGNAGDHWAVHREDALDANTTRDLADGEGGADSAAADGEANAFERLEALLVTFFDADVDANGVTGAEWWQVGAEPLFLGFDKWMHKITRGRGSRPETGSILEVDTQINRLEGGMPVGCPRSVQRTEDRGRIADKD